MDTPPPFRFVTGSLHVDFLKPTPMGVLEIRGRVKEIKGRKVVVESTVLAKGVATAVVTVVVVEVKEVDSAQAADPPEQERSLARVPALPRRRPMPPRKPQWPRPRRSPRPPPLPKRLPKRPPRPPIPRPATLVDRLPLNSSRPIRRNFLFRRIVSQGRILTSPYESRLFGDSGKAVFSPGEASFVSPAGQSCINGWNLISREVPETSIVKIGSSRLESEPSPARTNVKSTR